MYRNCPEDPRLEQAEGTSSLKQADDDYWIHISEEELAEILIRHKAEERN